MEVVLVVVWGALVGMDLIAVGQVMIARPIIAGAVAGWILGDIQAGLVLGGILELFSLEVLPFGPVRYPDYGVGTVVGVFAAHGSPLVFGVGLGAALALMTALAGEASVQFVRRLNTRDVHARSEELDNGSWRALRRVHVRSLSREVLRGVLLTCTGLLIAFMFRSRGLMDPKILVGVHVAIVGVGLGTAVTVGLRAARVKLGVASFISGAVVGLLWVISS